MKNRDFIQPIELNIVGKGSTFQRRTVQYWQNTTSSFIEEYWNSRNEQVFGGGEGNITGEASDIFVNGATVTGNDAVYDVTIQTRKVVQRRRTFDVTGAVENETNGRTLLYANNVQYTTSNLTYSPEVIVSEPFATLVNRDAYVSRLKEYRYNGIASFESMNFVTAPVILHSAPPSSVYSTEHNEFVSELRMSMQTIDTFLNESAIEDWQNATNTHIETYWTDVFFASTDIRVFNLDVTTILDTQLLNDPVDPDTVANVITIIYNQCCRYEYLGDQTEDVVGGARMIAATPFYTEESRGNFIQQLKITGNPSFDEVDQVFPVEYPTFAPTAAPSAPKPSAMPSAAMPSAAMTSGAPSAAPTAKLILRSDPIVNVAAVVITPLLICIVFAAGLCYFQVRRSRQKREDQRKRAALVTAKQGELAKQQLEQNRKEVASDAAVAAGAVLVDC
jgi:hypothetical protein